MRKILVLAIATLLLATPAAAATITIANGTYASPGTVPNGTASDWTIVKAATDGGVIVTGNTGLTSSSQYIQFEGLRFESSVAKTILGHHVKFLRCSFKGGPSSGNNAQVTIGTNDVNNTADILIEDGWLSGAGGRYNLLVYNATRVILRRVVVRHDGGWTDTKGDPEAGVTFYNTTDSQMQNVVVLDSNQPYHTWQSAIYSVYNTASPSSNARNKWLGVIALNNTSGADGAGLRFDGNGAQTGHVIQDAIFWDANWGLNVSYAAAVSIAAQRLTIGKGSGSTIGIGGSSGGTKTISNLRLFNATIQNVSPTNTAVGKPTYLPRQLSGVGASIENRVGVSGSLVGDPGYDTVSTVALWPWPNEARLKTEMCAGVTRGLCADSSLTHYIWNYPGNGDPTGGPTPPDPGPIPPDPTVPAAPTAGPLTCRVTLTATPPDSTTGWRAQWQQDGTNTGSLDTTSPYTRTVTQATGSTSLWRVVWSKLTGTPRTSAATTIRCQ